MTDAKRCATCGRTLPLASFHADKSSRDGLRADCADCRVAKNRLARFGVTAEEYQLLHAQQGGTCAICRLPETARANSGGAAKALAVDHEHGTGRVRGLLCSACNQGLGKFRDNPGLLVTAAQYLAQGASEVSHQVKESA